MAGDARVAAPVCASTALEDCGPGVRFAVLRQGTLQPAFVIRYRGRVHAYVNECRHQRTELDWQPGQFFDEAKLYLVCASHGALYAPDTGACVAGPCRGDRLRALPVQERGGQIYCVEE